MKIYKSFLLFFLLVAVAITAQDTLKVIDFQDAKKGNFKTDELPYC
jgi:hypothetical protein